MAEPTAVTASSAPSFPRHRIHRRTKDQESKVTAGNNHPLPAIKESLPASGGGNSSCGSGRSSGVQFDLEAAAFPPLPGLDADHGKGSTDICAVGVGVGGTGIESASQNRLSDVVKGTAKLKAAVKDKESGNHQQSQLQQPQQQQQPQQPPPVPPVVPVVTNTANRSASPGASTGSEAAQAANALGNAAASSNPANAAHALNPPATANNENATSSADAVALSTVALTPPSSPDKSVKTDDSNMVNGVDDAVVANAHLLPAVVTSTISTAAAAATTTAATTTTATTTTTTTMTTTTTTTATATATATATTTTTTTATATTTSTTTTGATTATAEDAQPMTRCDCNSVVVVPPPTASQSSQSQTGVASAFPIDLTRPSYAQVAQHCRELPCTKHKADERDRNV